MVLAAGPPPNAASGISLESMPHLTAEILKILNPVEIHPALLNLGTSPNHDHGYIFRVMGGKKKSTEMTERWGGPFILRLRLNFENFEKSHGIHGLQAELKVVLYSINSRRLDTYLISAGIHLEVLNPATNPVSPVWKKFSQE